MKTGVRTLYNILFTVGFILSSPYYRAVLETAGVRDILPKSLGSSNQLNMIRATLLGLESLKDPETLAKIRGKNVEDVQPVWRRQRVQQQA